jgi:hypothetical protein
LNAAGQRRGGRRIAGHDVDGELLALEGIEAGLAELPGPLAGASGFRVVDDWLVGEALLRARLAALPFSRTAGAEAPIPGQPARGRAASFRRLVSSRRVLSRSGACAIFFRTNVRAFYSGEAPVTLWMAGAGCRTEDLARALQIRGRAAGSPLRTPRILCQRLASAPAYVLEETILGRSLGKPGDWRLVADGLLPALLGFYDRGGIRHKRASELFDAPAIEEQLAALTGDLESGGAWKRRWLPRRELLAACADCLRWGDATMPLCTGHGDLTKTNILVVRDGTIVVVDWEHSRELPIALEVVKLVRQHPPLARRLEPELEARTEDPIAMSGERQLLIAVFARLAALTRFEAEDRRGDRPEVLRARRARKAGFWLRFASELLGRRGPISGNGPVGRQGER